VLFFVVAASFSWIMFARAPQPLRSDIWFDSDTNWVFLNVTNSHVLQRNQKHPLFAAFIFPIVKGLSLLGIPKPTGVRVVFSSIAGGWAVLLYIVLASSVPTMTDAAVFTCLGLVSAAFVFWSWIPETFILGSATILFALLTVRVKGRLQASACYIAGVATLAVTVTNWFAAIITAAIGMSFRRAAVVSLLALGTVAGLAYGEMRVVRTQGFFLDLRQQSRTQGAYLNHEAGGSLQQRWRAALFLGLMSPGVTPRVVEINGANKTMLSSQSVPGGLMWTVGICLWSALLVGGGWAVVASRSPIGLSAIAIVGFHLMLHTFYGYEVFLYSAHVVPALIVIASQSVMLSRRWSLAAALGVVGLAAAQNWSAFRSALELLQTS